MKTAQYKALNGNPVGDITGAAFCSANWIAASFVPAFTDSSANGTVKIQVSNEPPVGDPYAYTPSAGSWQDLTNATSSISSGAGPAITLAAPFAFGFIRVVYTHSSGTGGANKGIVNACVMS